MLIFPLLLYAFKFVEAQDCTTSQVYVEDTCVDCASLFGSCIRCSQNSDSISSYQCDECTDGLYLLRATTQNILDYENTEQEELSLCVNECTDFAYNYVNNQNTMQCEFCGEGCQQCSPQVGCLSSSIVDHGFRFNDATLYPTSEGLYSTLVPSDNFVTPQLCSDARCDKCQTYDNVDGVTILGWPVCDSCFQYVNFYPITKQALLNCALCTNEALNNCATCDPDRPELCASCDTGYYLIRTATTSGGDITVKTVCSACTLVTGCNRCDNTGCLECDAGYALTSDASCLACDLTDFNADYFYEPTRCTQCSAFNATECAYCTFGYFDSYSTPDECALKCDNGQYPFVEFNIINFNENVILSTACLVCDESCATCVGPDLDQCLTCIDSDFLLIGKVSEQTGTCFTRVADTGVDESYDIFVTPTVPYDAVYALVWSDMGDYSNAFWDLEFALVRAQELAVMLDYDVTINIYLLNGDHYVIRDRGDTELLYKPTLYKPNDNLNYHLTIQPLPCTYETEDFDVADVCTDDVVTIYNKHREQFTVPVPLSLTMTNIKIDSLDSILFSLDSDVYDTSCLSERYTCCQIENDVLSSVYGGSICELALAAYLTSQESQCLVNQPRAMFAMQLNDQDDVLSPNNVTLTNVEITNMFYAVNSIVSLTPIWGLVTIIDSTFSRLNICGSIVKSWYDDVATPDVLANINYLYLSDLQRNLIDSLSNTPSFNQNPGAQTCEEDECFTIAISGSDFSSIPYMRSQITNLILVAEENGLQHQGLIVSVDGMEGSITINDCTFSTNQVPFDTCEPKIPSTASSLNNFDQMFSSTSDHDKLQQTSLISIQKHVGAISISGNTFSDNVMTSGLIMIDSSPSSSADTTLISGNTFSANGALYNSDVLQIRQCRYVTIQSNTFDENCGCQETGVLLLQCVSDDFTYQTAYDFYYLEDGITPTTGSEVTMTSNTFTGNFVGKDKHVVSIEGFEVVTITGDSYSYNENYLPQSFNQMSPLADLISEQHSDVTTLDGFDYKAQAILRVASTEELDITSLSFEANWVADHQSYQDDYQANALLIQDLIGTLSMDTVDFLSHEGVQSSNFASISGDGYRSGLLVFKNIDLSKLTFSSVTFMKNSLHYSKDPVFDTQVVMPTLFQLSHPQISQTSTISLNSLIIDGNDCVNGDYMVFFQLKRLLINVFEITSNNGTNIVVIDVPTDLATQLIQLKNGEVTSNSLYNGAVFLIREASDFVFSYADIKPSSTEPASFKVLFDTVDFKQNTLLSDLGKTSCILVEKSVERNYPWMSMNILDCDFKANKGKLTSAIWIADSMISWLILESVNFAVSTSTATTGRLAQVLYKNDQYGYLRVSNCDFQCSHTYDDKIIMFYDLESVEGRPSLFRFTDPSAPVRLAQIDGNNTKDNGTLDTSDFRNQFNTNTYQFCNQHSRGSVFYLESGAQVYETDSDYYKMSALEGGLAYLDGDGTYLTIELAQRIKNVYAYYGGIIYATNGATAEIFNQTTVSFCEAYEGTVVYLTQRARLLMTLEIKLQSLTATKGAMIFSSNGCQFWLEDVLFTNCKAGYQSSIINIENGREQYHLVNGETRISYGVSYYLKSYIINCQITRSSVEERGRLISVSEASLYIGNSSFYANEQINFDNYGVEVFSGNLQIIETNFTGTSQSFLFNNIYQRDLQEINGAFVAVYGVSTVEIGGSIFENGRGEQGGCIALFGSIETYIYDTQFIRCAAMLGGAIYSSAFASLMVESSTFKDNIGYQGYGQNIYAVGGTGEFNLIDCELHSYQNSVYVSSKTIIIDTCQFVGSDSTIENLGRSNGGGLNIAYALNTKITSTSFTNLRGINGGAIFFAQYSDNTLFALNQRYQKLNYGFSIKETTFRGCTAELNGGSIYLQDIKGGQISSSSFQNSIAVLKGGAIYFWCEPLSLAQQKQNGIDCSLNLAALTFDNCTAQEGGAIIWNFVEPIFKEEQGNFNLAQGPDETFTYQSMTFIKCRASKYGPQIAGVARELAQVSNQTFQMYYNQSSPKRQNVLQFADRRNVTQQRPALTRYTYGGVQSGGNVPVTWFALLDKYGQVVQTNSGGQLRFNLDMPKVVEGNFFNTDILGMVDFYSMFGTFQMENMGIVSQPGINISVSITVNAVDIRVPTTNSYLTTWLNNGKAFTNNLEYQIDIIMRVRPCILGEGLKPSGACFTCPSGSFLLTIPVEPVECAICQIEKAICLGGSDIGPLPNYWRKSKDTYFFLPCKVPGACLGKDETLAQDEPGNAVGLCNLEAGYYGVLCTACLPRYKRSDTFACDQCLQIEPYFTAGAFFILIFGLCFLINSTIKGAASNNNTHSVFNKILMNHMQMLLITASFDMSWPEEVKLIFNIAAPIAQITSSITSFDCYMDSRDPSVIDPYDFYADPYDLRIIYQKLFIMAGLPLFMAASSYSIWYVILRYKKALAEHQTRFIASLVLLLFLVHPSITQAMIDMFNCQDLDGEIRLVVDMQVICYEGLHFYMAWGLALPCLILWGLGIPLIVLIMMRKDSDKLDTVAVKQKFGFLYNGYKRHNYFWEIVIMYRKILCIFIAVFLNRVGIIVQALVLLIMLVVFLQANSTNRPFAERALNDIEALSLATQIVTIYCGIFFISAKDKNSSTFDKNRDFYLSAEGKLVFFGVIAFCNVAFLVLWLVKFIVVIKVLIKERYPRLYVVIFLCGRSDKMVLETAKRARDTKKEAIIESMEAVSLMMNKMKSMYANNVFYEDHNRFLRLLYYIESERQQIDLKEKRHNYYIQGQIARHRRFDPEIVKEAQDKRPIQVEDNFLHQEKQKFKRGVAKLQGMIRLHPTTPLRKVGVGSGSKPQSENGDQSTIRDNSEFVLMKHGASGVGPDLLDIDEMSEEVIRLPKEDKRPQQKKRKRKINQADLNAVYLNSRNAAVALKTEKSTHIRALDVSKLDGSIRLPELPQYLRGFKDEYQEETKVEKQFRTIDSVPEKLHIMRQLTDRIINNDSPTKSPAKIKSKTTGVSESEKQGGQTQIDVESGRLSGSHRDSQDLKPYNEKDDVKLREKSDPLAIREVYVTRGDGGEAAPMKQPEQPQDMRLRPKNAVRNVLIGNQIVQIDHGIPQDEDDELMITIMDDNDEFVQKPQFRKKKTNLRQLQSKPSEPFKKNPIQPEEFKLPQGEKAQTESFHTDMSMKDYDLMQEEGTPMNFHSAPFTYNEKKTDPQVGEGLIRQPLEGPQFHPTVSPGIIFDSSVSGQGDDQEDSQEDAMDSRRQLEPPVFQLGNLTDKSRN